MSERDLTPPPVANVGTPDGHVTLKALELRPVLMSEELAALLSDRVDWGEPDADGWYTPTFYVVTGKPVRA